MRYQAFIFLLSTFIYGAFSLPDAVVAQARTFRCDPEKLEGVRVLSIARLGSTKYQSNLYEYAVAKTSKGKIPIILRQREALICGLVFVDLSGGDTSLSKGIPAPVANAFAIMLLKKRISQDGIQAVQARINTRTEINAEDAYAAEKLGLNVPSSIKLIPYSTAPKMEIIIYVPPE